MPADTVLFDLASALLDHIVDTVGEGNVPGRRYVHQGEIADDECSQLVVSIGPMYLGFPGQQATTAEGQRGAKRSFDLTVAWFRCVPTLDEQDQAPSSQALSDKAEEIATDGFRLFKAVQSSKKLVFGECSNVTLYAMQPYGPSGAHGGWVQGIGVEL